MWMSRSIFLLSALWALPAVVSASMSSSDQGCQQIDLGSSCTETATPPPSTPAAVIPEWQKEMEKAQKANAECQADIEKFCEGVQVGEGRIEACLKKHQKKLSKKCRTAQRL